MDDLDTVVNDLVKLGSLPAAPQAVPNGNTPYVVIPHDFKVEDLGRLIYNEHQAKPERVKQNVKVLDVQSFIEYYTLFNDPNSRVFAYEPQISVTAILDYHAAGEGTPRWGSHRLTLTLEQSVEWRRWLGNNNQHVDQQKFAEFLEQNGIDITDPTPAAMMEVARDLQATTEVQFGSGLRMGDGQVKFKYTEETKSTVGGSQISVPEQFTINIPVFVGGDRVSMNALLRWRCKEGKLTFWYTLIRPEEVLRQAFLDARNQIADTLKIKIINGDPK